MAIPRATAAGKDQLVAGITAHSANTPNTINDCATRCSCQRLANSPSANAPNIPPTCSSTPPAKPLSADKPACSNSLGVQLVTK